MSRAPRPVPLRRRATQAQLIKGLYLSLDETWGSGHAPSAADQLLFRRSSDVRRRRRDNSRARFSKSGGNYWMFGHHSGEAFEGRRCEYSDGHPLISIARSHFPWPIATHPIAFSLFADCFSRREFTLSQHLTKPIQVLFSNTRKKANFGKRQHISLTSFVSVQKQRSLFHPFERSIKIRLIIS